MRLLLLCVLLLSGKAYGVLSPLNQSIREIKELLNSPEITNLDQGEPIKEVIRLDKGYLVLTDSYELYAKVNYAKNSRVGPREFSLEFEKPLKRK